MISLENQFQGVVIALFSGFVFAFLFSVFKKVITRKLNIIFKFILDTLFMLLGTLIYFYLNVYYTDGHIFIYIPLFIFIGIFLYYYFYYEYIDNILNKIINRVNNKILKPFKLFIKRIYDIILTRLRKGVKKHAKKFGRKSKSLESKQSRKYYYDWSFNDSTNDNG